MTTVGELHRAVQATLASKRVGQPVFVRYLLHGREEAESLRHRLAGAVGVVREWFGQPLERVYAVGSAGGGQVSLTLQFASGATALVSYARGQSPGSGIDLLVLGNHGAINHDAGAANLWDEAPAEAKEPDPALLALIDRAILSGKPEVLSGEDRP